MSNKTHFTFIDYKLSVAQTHDTASQLCHTIHEFKHGESNRNHLIGKLKFFIDLYTDMSHILDINETATIDNYYQLLSTLAQDFTEEDFSDVMHDYLNYFVTRINNIFKYIDDNAILDVDQVIDYINSQENLNFQEQQFIADIYYANCSCYKLQTSDNSNETDYYDVRHMAAINDYCKEYNLQPTEVLVREIYDVDDGKKVYTEQEFYTYLLHNEGLDLDFIRGFDGIKTIHQWIIYTINTLKELNDDLITIDPNDKAIEINNSIIDKLNQIIN